MKAIKRLFEGPLRDASMGQRLGAGFQGEMYAATAKVLGDEAVAALGDPSDPDFWQRHSEFIKSREAPAAGMNAIMTGLPEGPQEVERYYADVLIPRTKRHAFLRGFRGGLMGRINTDGN